VKKHVQGNWHVVSATAYFTEYLVTGKDGRPMAMWARMPHNQLAKCAEALAIRRAFPDDIGPARTDEEMEQADSSPVFENQVEEANRAGIAQDEATQGETIGDAHEDEAGIESLKASVPEETPATKPPQPENGDFGKKRAGEIESYIKRAPSKAHLISASKQAKHAHDNGDITDAQFQAILSALEKKEDELTK
jgi:hypothetical protein